MRTRYLRLFVAASLALALLAPAYAGAGDGNTQPLHTTPAGDAQPAIESKLDLWFVELASPPAVEGTARAQLAREKQAFRTEARRAGIEFTERYAYDTLWNGFSLRVRPDQVGSLAGLPGVKAVYPVVSIDVPEPGSTPDLGTALAMTGADVAQNELGLTGAGIKVAIMDTGIDYDHPDLGGPGPFPTARVIAGYDFVGDAFNASDPANNTPQPDDDPMDCNGHGTHVAGITGAHAADESGVTGVAPGVTFGAYKVFGCEGSTTADIMMAAMEMALADGMDVLNMSIGAAFQWPQYPTAVASDRLVDRGMVVVASIGNSGASGVYSAGAPGVGSKVIGVASFDNSHINALTFNVNPGGQQVAYLPLATTQEPPTSGTSEEVVWVGRGCTSLGDTPVNDPVGKVALIVRGDCTFNEKYAGAVAAGAEGVVIYNNVTGLFAGGGVTDLGIFGIGISNADGLHIRSLLDANEAVTLTWTDERVNAPNPTGGLISSFSSYGLAPDLTLKPDLGAPGGLIRSTYPLALGGYATISGTSMSAPHVAGAAALLLEADPKIRSQHMRTVLQNTASPKNWWGNPGLGFLDNVHRQGAGMIDIPAAVAATTRVTPSKLALGESEAGPSTPTLVIENRGTSAVTYTLAHVPALSTGGSTFAPSFFTGFASVVFGTSEVTVPAGGTANVGVTITANPALPNGSQYGGYLVATGDNGETVRVPYAGFKGDYQSLVVLRPDASPFGNPLLRASLSFGPSEDVTIDPSAGEVAYLLFHAGHQSRTFRVEVEDANTGRNLGRVINLDYFGRNSTAGGFFVLEFDGVTTRGNSGRAVMLPNGEYVLKVSVLKALGDAANPAHWETWTSPTRVTIDRG